MVNFSSVVQIVLSVMGDPMLQFFFHWFYCLPIIDALFLILVVCVVFFFLCRRFGKERFWRVLITVLFLTWIMIILAGTLLYRSPEEVPERPVWLPFYSYYCVFTGGNREILRSNLMNVLLFFPAGLFCCELLPDNWRGKKKVILVTVLFAIISAGIELSQYHFALGQAEVDDMIHNALGAMLGAWICFEGKKLGGTGKEMSRNDG